jgi:hypothetical protein
MQLLPATPNLKIESSAKDSRNNKMKRKYYKLTEFAAKARAERTQSKTRIRVREGWRFDLPRQIGALGEPGRFTVPGVHQRVGVKHFSV